MNIHETIMQLIGGRAIPLSLVVISFFALSGIITDEESTMKLIDQADEPLEHVYATAILIRDVTLWVIVATIFAISMWSIRKVNGHDKDK